jgi:hypothetical protein
MMDGISGIKIYNKLQVDSSFLPVRYGKTLNFIITGVNHRLQNNDWETTLETIVMPKTSKLEPSDYDISSISRDIAIAASTIQSSASPTLFTSGNGIDPIKNLIAIYESGDDYNAYNYGKSGGTGRKSSTKGSNIFSETAIKLTDKTSKYVNETLQRKQTVDDKVCNPLSKGIGDMFAVGRYQTTPCSLKNIISKLKIESSLFNESTQEKIGDYLLLDSRESLSSYLKGTNKGTQSQLTNAVQAISQIFASMPAIKTKDGTVVGWVSTGGGRISYYGGDGPNPKLTKPKIADVVQALIKSRIQYTQKDPLDLYKPPYYKPTYVLSKVSS